MSTFGYRRELSKYEDIDEDELLASLTEEELKELERELEDIEPDRNLPVGQRQKSLTEKTPTGTFSREALMAYWERETKKLLEEERLGACDKVRRRGICCFLEICGFLIPWHNRAGCLHFLSVSCSIFKNFISPTFVPAKALHVSSESYCSLCVYLKCSVENRRKSCKNYH